MPAATNARKRPIFRHPAQLVAAGFAGAVAVGSAVLMLPIAKAGEGGADALTAIFTSTSAVCVTGLTVTDTATYWSTFGQIVIMLLIQVGGFGIMTLASMLGLMVARRLDLRTRMTAASETKATGIGDIRTLLIGVLVITLIVELAVAIVLTLRFYFAYDEPFGRAIYLGIFHSISSFNNAGFALFSDNLMGFVTDPWICLPSALATIIGGLGFPVVMELWRRYRRPRSWSLHTKLTLLMTGILLAGGTAFITIAEWSNPGTLGPLSVPGKLLAGFFHGVQPRTAGFNSLDMGAMSDTTLLGTDILMFIGGGSAGTAGGIKVTTFVVLLFVIIAEVRGERTVTAFRRTIDQRVSRQALTVALLAVACVVGGTVVVQAMTGLPLSQVLFEVISALGTVGLSTGITADLPGGADIVLILLMFFGRLGPVTLVSALALREKPRHYEYPEERPVIG